MKYTPILTEKFAKTTEEHGMLRCSSVVAALSGGADSAVLLHLLANACKARSIALYALHVHHGIRGAEADRDADFCADLCRSLSVPLEIVRLDVPAMAAAQGQGLEEAARDARYAALADFCARMGVERIATAHQADDNLETLLFHLIRGAGSRGGGGIAPVRGQIIRPLIACTREEILGYAAENGIPYVEDSTNADLRYSRNFLRHQVIPLLKTLNPSLPESALRFSDHLRQDDDLLNRIAAGQADDRSCAHLAAPEEPIGRRVIRMAYFEASGAVLPAGLTQSLLELVRKDREGSRICLPGGISGAIRRHTLVFEPTAVPEVKSYRYVLHMGENFVPEIGALIYLYSEIGKNEEKAIKEKQNIYKLFIHRSLDFAKIAYSDLVVRNKSDGDVIRYGGMTRRVKKLLWERKIPPDRRAVYPVLEDSSGILWLPGFPVCDRAVPNGPGRRLHLCFFADPQT